MPLQHRVPVHSQHSAPRSAAALTPRSATLLGQVERPVRSGGSCGSTCRCDSAAIAGNDSSALGLNIEQLLSALQRGTVPGANANVAFLCQKFTGLLERLQRAESGEKELESQCSAVSCEIESERLGEQSDCSELEAAAAAERENIAKLETSLIEIRSEEANAQRHLSRARAETEETQQRRVSLDEQCASERSRLAEVSSRFRQMQLTRPAGHAELKRLQTHLQTITGQYHAAAKELEEHRERASREDARLSELKAEALSEEESRDRASELAAKHREELGEALGELALLKERLAEAHVGIQRCEDELQRKVERRLAVQAELQKYDTWLSNAARELEDLQEVERGLARVHTDSSEVRATLALEEAELRNVEAAHEAKEMAMAENNRQLEERARHYEEVESEREALRLEVSRAEEQQAHLEASIEQLLHDQATGGGLRRNLEQETQLLLAEAERLRRERDSRLAERSDMLQRLRLLTPTLSEARRRVRELEDSLENLSAETSRERQLSERLEREAGGYQDKMRVLRDQNVKLAEQCTELESQLQNTPSRRSEAFPLRSRSASACGSRLRGKAMVASARSRRPSCDRINSARSTARARPMTPLGVRPVAVSTPGRCNSEVVRLGFDGSFEGHEGNDAIASAEQHWKSIAAPIRQAPCSASRERVECLTPVEFDMDSGGVGRSTPVGSASGEGQLQYLREWIQSEEERLGPASRS